MSRETELSLAVVQSPRDEILLVERAATQTLADGSRLRLAFPGGKREPGELWEVTAARETLEETGYEVGIVGQITRGPHPLVPEVHVAYWACRLVSEQPHATNDPAIRGVLWVPRTQLLHTLTTPLNPSVASYLNLS